MVNLGPAGHRPIPINDQATPNVPPKIVSLSTNLVVPGDHVAIVGSNFGTYGGTGPRNHQTTGHVSLTVNGVVWESGQIGLGVSQLQLQGWGNKEVIFVVPTKDAAGNDIEAGTVASVTVTAVNNGKLLASNSVPLAIALSPPETGLGSNSNYILSSACNPIQGLAVTVIVTEDIVWQSSSGTVEGFGFQLNCYSEKDEKNTAEEVIWTQYIFGLFGNDLYAVINVFGAISGLGSYQGKLVSFPDVSIPAGITLSISLGTDAQGNVINVTFAVGDAAGNVQAEEQISLFDLTGGNITSLNTAATVAFQLNLVGPENGESAVLSAGACSITYSASTPLTTLSAIPSCAAFLTNGQTEEQANSVYGPMPGSPSDVLYQSFTVAAP